MISKKCEVFRKKSSPEDFVKRRHWRRHQRRRKISENRSFMARLSDRPNRYLQQRRAPSGHGKINLDKHKHKFLWRNAHCRSLSSMIILRNAALKPVVASVPRACRSTWCLWKLPLASELVTSQGIHGEWKLPESQKKQHFFQCEPFQLLEYQMC